MSFCQRDLDKQQLEIEVLRRSYQPPNQGSWNLPPEPRSAGAARPGASNSFPEPVPVPREPAGLGCGPIRNGGGYRAHGGPQPGDTCRNCGRKGHLVLECRGAEEYGSMPADPREMGGSISIVTDERNGVDAYLALGLNGR